MLAPTRDRFAAGLSAAWTGLRLSTRSAGLRRTYAQLVAGLLVAGLVFDAVGIWAVLHWTTADPGAAWWAVVGWWVARVLGIGVVLLAAPLLSLTLVNISFPFLGERVFMAAMEVVSPARAAQLAAAPGLPWSTSVVVELRRLVGFVLLSSLVLLASLVPVAGQVFGPVLQGYFSARALAWELLDPYLDKLQLGYAEQRAFVAAHRPALVGFGLPLGLLMAVPLVGPLLFGLAQGAAAQLVVEVIEAPSSRGV